MDYIPKEIETDYEEEPDEDEAHIRQVHQIILEREKIREKMKNLGVDHIQKIENLEKLQKTKIALLAAKGLLPDIFERDYPLKDYPFFGNIKKLPFKIRAI